MVYLGKRDIYGDDGYDDGYDGYHGGWWHSETAEVIRWVIVAALLFGLFLLVAGGYVHARRRVRRGQTPLRYHRVSPPYLPRCCLGWPQMNKTVLDTSSVCYIRMLAKKENAYREPLTRQPQQWKRKTIENIAKDFVVACTTLPPPLSTSPALHFLSTPAEPK